MEPKQKVIFNKSFIQQTKNCKEEDLKNIDSLDYSAVYSQFKYSITSIEDVSFLYNLSYLSLSGHELTDIEPLSRLIQLRTLDLSSNRISNIESLSSLVFLEELNVSHNALQLVPQSFIHLVNLHILNLSFNLIPTMNNINILSSLYNLINLNILNNPICAMDQYEKEVILLIPSLILLNNQLISFDQRNQLTKQTSSSFYSPPASTFIPTTSYEQPLSYDVPMTNNDSDFDSQSVYSTHSYASYCPQFMTSSLPAKERIQEQAPLPVPMEPLPSSSFQQDMNQIHQQKATIDQQYQELMKKQEKQTSPSPSPAPSSSLQSDSEFQRLYSEILSIKEMLKEQKQTNQSIQEQLRTSQLLNTSSMALNSFSSSVSNDDLLRNQLVALRREVQDLKVALLTYDTAMYPSISESATPLPSLHSSYSYHGPSQSNDSVYRTPQKRKSISHYSHTPGFLPAMSPYRTYLHSVSSTPIKSTRSMSSRYNYDRTYSNNVVSHLDYNMDTDTVVRQKLDFSSDEDNSNDNNQYISSCPSTPTSFHSYKVMQRRDRVRDRGDSTPGLNSIESKIQSLRLNLPK